MSTPTVLAAVRPASAIAASALLLAWMLNAQVIGQNKSTLDGRLALVGGTVYIDPMTDPVRDGVVVIQEGKITFVGRKGSTRIPQDIQIIDCAGMTVTAGLWNSHVHLLQRKWADAATLPSSELTRQLQEMLTQYGFTSAFDTWSMWENTRRLRDRIESGEIAGPRIRTTGEAIVSKGVAATPASWAALGFMALEGFQVPRVTEASEVAIAAKKLLDSGVDGLKFYAATPGRTGVVMPDDVIRAGVKEAHSRGKPVFAHPTSEAGLLASVRAGVDIVAHTTPQSGPWSQGTLSAMKRAGIALIPTLKLWKYEFRHERMSLADGFVKTAVSQLRAWVGAGGVVLFGTDVGYMSEYDPTEEYSLMAEAGMGFPQILASLTTAPADRFGASTQLGRVAAGFAADLTVLRRDPSKDIRALSVVGYTIRDGKVIYRAATSESR